jgi:hypothetical protein
MNARPLSDSARSALTGRSGLELVSGAPRHLLQRQSVAVGIGKPCVLDSSAYVFHGADVNAAADELSACLLYIGHHQVQALDRAGCHLVVGGAIRCQCRSSRPSLPVSAARLGHPPPAARRRLQQNRAVQCRSFFAAVHIGDWNRHQLELHLHQVSFGSRRLGVFWFVY